MSDVNTEAGLLRAMMEEPHNDDLKLIYADWLDDHGEEEQAEIHRIRVELARMGEPPLFIGEHWLKPLGGRTYLTTYPRYEMPKVGQRVDLVSISPSRRRRRLYGLLCTRCDVSRGLTVRIVLKIDEKSKRFDHSRHNTLCRRERGLLKILKEKDHAGI